MKIKTPTAFQTFNDGVCVLCGQKNQSAKGNVPKKTYIIKEMRMPYERRTVGVRRFYDAKQDKAEIELLLRVPCAFNVSTQDICIVGGIQYGVYQVQDVMDVLPAAKDIALKRLEAKYDITGV